MLSQQPKNTNIAYALGMGMQLGLLIALPLILSIGLGLFLDRTLKTFPVILIISIFMGMILTVVDVYKIVLPFLEKRSGDNKNNN